MIGSRLQALADMAPGAIKGLHLVVGDITEARAELVHGVSVDATISTMPRQRVCRTSSSTTSRPNPRRR